MALSSPGVEVNVIDESFYTPAAGATVPLIMVATAESKPNGSGTGTAAGTLKSNAGKVYLITSQRELTDTFGNPTFYTDASNNPLHGSELNEYGLQAAYSYLGVANRAYVVRADVDLGELSGSASSPAGPAVDGTYWFDTDDSNYGIFVWDKSAQKFTNVTPTIISSASDLVGWSGATYTGVKSSVGAVGDYAIVTWNTENKVWYKNSSNNWVQVGSEDESYFNNTGFDSATTWSATTWASSHATVIGSKSPGSLANGGAIIINGQTVTNSGATVETLAQSINTKSRQLNMGVGAKVTTAGRLELYSDGTSKADGSSMDGGILVQIPRDGSGNATSTYVGPSVADTGDLGIVEGYYAGPALQISAHTKIPQWKSGDTVDIGATTYDAIRPNGSVWIKSTDPNLGASWKLKLYSSATGLWTTVNAPIYNSAAEAIKAMDATGGTKISTGMLFIKANTTGSTDPLAQFKIYRRVTPSPTTATGGVNNPAFTAGTKEFTISETIAGDATPRTAQTVTFTGTTAEDMVAAISAEGLTNVLAEVTATGAVKISHKLGGEIILTEVTGNPLTTAGFVTTKPDNVYSAPADSGATIVISNWKPLVYTASAGAPSSTPEDGTLWYSTTLDEVDIMVHDGVTWRGYHNVNAGTEIIVSATQPTVQTDGTALVNGDIWVDSSASEVYGQNIYKWDGNNLEWVAVDVSDQTTEDGILFADARYGYTGATGDTAADISEYLTSDYLDPDAPDPDLYPRGMLLWNTRRSGYNVKKFVKGHIDLNDNNGRNIRFQGSGTSYNGGTDESMASYKVDRWVGWNTTAEDGSGLFGRHAQRKTVVAAMKSEIDTNQDLRDEETRTFTLLSAPGYTEATSNLVNLNVDRGITGFVVADTPFRLGSTATELLNYGNNGSNALADGEKGFLTYDEYMATFYPSGFTTDVNGNNIVVPPSYMMLRTIALSDAVSYPWFAPAGTRRGGITNASSVGFIDGEGEFKAVALNEGVRDTMAQVKINPLTYITGSGLVNFGQFTRARNASALDRINVARLVAYLRRQLTLLAKPFMFEPNDKITRDEIKQAAESLLLELVGQRALYDFLVVCDESNNTPSRIDRSELYLDIAIEPVKAVEFIYIPLRLKNTGEIATLGAN